MVTITLCSTVQYICFLAIDSVTCCRSFDIPPILSDTYSTRRYRTTNVPPFLQLAAVAVLLRHNHTHTRDHAHSSGSLLSVAQKLKDCSLTHSRHDARLRHGIFHSFHEFVTFAWIIRRHPPHGKGGCGSCA